MIIQCKKCRKLRPNGAKGFCRTCYKVEWAKKKIKENGRDPVREKWQKIYDISYYQKNKETIKKRARDYYQAHRLERIAYDKKRNQTAKRKTLNAMIQKRDQPKLAQAAREKRRLHPEIHRRHKQNRRARIRNLPHSLTDLEWSNILEHFNYACAYCGATNTPLQQEHKTPIVRGGGYTSDNIVPACGSCNRHKHTKTESEFREYLVKFPR